MDWRFVTPGLEPLTRVLVPERPGYGNNPLPAGGFASNAAAMISLLDEQNLDKAIVVGHSWGGGIAIKMAEDFPDRVGGIVLVSSIGPGAVTLLDRLMTLPGVSRVAASLTVRVGGAALHPKMNGPLNHLLGSRLRSAAESLLRRDRRRRLVGTFVVEQQALVDEMPGLMDRLSLIKAPVSIIHARNDHFISIRVARSLKVALPAAELAELRTGAHYLPHKAPDVIVSATTSLLNVGR